MNLNNDEIKKMIQEVEGTLSNSEYREVIGGRIEGNIDKYNETVSALAVMHDQLGVHPPIITEVYLVNKAVSYTHLTLPTTPYV